MRFAISCLLVVACHSESKVAHESPTLASSGAQPGSSSSAPTSSSTARPIAPTSPPGTAGTCRADAKVAGVEDRDQPAAIAFCPDPMEMMRGNGMPPDHPPAVPTTTPPWDQDAVRDYACAYACAAPGAHAYLLAWSVWGDNRPTQAHDTVYVIEHSPASGAPTWSIVIMYKRSFNAWWNINTSPHERSRSIVTFDHRPRPEEVQRVLDANGWSGRGIGDMKLLASLVVADNWQIALGGPPP